MWNSNSLIAWLLARSGHDTTAIAPPGTAAPLAGVRDSRSRPVKRARTPRPVEPGVFATVTVVLGSAWSLAATAMSVTNAITSAPTAKIENILDGPDCGSSRTGGGSASRLRRRRAAGFYVSERPAGVAIAAWAAATRAIGRSVGRAGDVVEAGAVEEADGVGVAAVLAADAELEVGPALAAASGGHAHEPAGPYDVRLGAVAGVPVVIDDDQDRRWHRPAFTIGVAPGEAGGFSLEALEQLHFTAGAGEELGGGTGPHATAAGAPASRRSRAHAVSSANVPSRRTAARRPPRARGPPAPGRAKASGSIPSWMAEP